MSWKHQYGAGVEKDGFTIYRLSTMEVVAKFQYTNNRSFVKRARKSDKFRTVDSFMDWYNIRKRYSGSNFIVLALDFTDDDYFQATYMYLPNTHD